MMLGAQRQPARSREASYLCFSVDVSGFFRVWKLSPLIPELECLANLHFFPEATWFGSLPPTSHELPQTVWLGGKMIRSVPIEDLLTKDVLDNAPIDMELIDERPLQLSWFDYCARISAISLGVVVPTPPLSVWTVTKKTVNVWDGSALQIRQSLSKHAENVTSIFHCHRRSPNMVLTGDSSGKVVVWNAKQLSGLYQFNSQPAPVALMVISPVEFWSVSDKGQTSVWMVNEELE